MATVDASSSVYGARLNVEQTVTRNLIKEGRNYAQRKRAGATLVSALVSATLASMTQAFFALPDSTRSRNKRDVRQARARLEKRIASLLDQLLRMDGGDVQLSHVSALYAVVDEMLLKKLGGEIEDQVRPFVKKYIQDSADQDLVTLLERLQHLADADLFSILDEQKYNGREAREAVRAMKNAVLRQMALRGIVTPLEVFSACLSQSVLDNTDLVATWGGGSRRHAKRRRMARRSRKHRKGEISQAWGREIGSAWYTLHHCMCIADRGGAEPVEYLQAGLEQLSEQQIKMLAVVMAADGERAEHVPLHARWARHFLGQAAADTAQLAAIDGTMGVLDLQILQLALTQCIDATLKRLVDDGTRKLDRGCRPGVRTGEVANFVWRSFRKGVDKTGAIYVYPLEDNAADDLSLDATLDRETEKYFAQALMNLVSGSLQLFCLNALDDNRLCAVAAMRTKWTETQQQALTPLVDQACRTRYQQLQGTVTTALETLQHNLSIEGRDMLPQRLLALSDALAGRDHFAESVMLFPSVDDHAIDRVIAEAVACLRVPGDNVLPNALGQEASARQDASLAHPSRLAQKLSLEQGSFLGQKSLQGLSDAQFGELLYAYRGKLPTLGLHAAGVENEVLRRIAPFDQKVMKAQQHLLEWLTRMSKSGKVAQRSYQVKSMADSMIAALVTLTRVEVARQDQIAILGAEFRQAETSHPQTADPAQAA